MCSTAATPAAAYLAPTVVIDGVDVIRNSAKYLIYIFILIMKYCNVLALAGFLLFGACMAAAPAAPTAANVMAISQPDIKMAIRAVKNNDPDLAAYLADPTSVCTFFAPTDKAMGDWMRWFGRYAGKAVQNTTFMHSALNYHVVPGRALTAQQIGKDSKVLTRANETLFFYRKAGQPYVYSRPDFPISIKDADLKAGKCIVHKVNMALVPPTSSNMVQAWVNEIGQMPPAPPKSQWAPKQEPLPQSLEATAKTAAAGSAEPAAAAAPTPPSAAASSPSKSSANRRFTLSGRMALMSCGAAAIAALLL